MDREGIFVLLNKDEIFFLKLIVNNVCMFQVNLNFLKICVYYLAVLLA